MQPLVIGQVPEGGNRGCQITQPIDFGKAERQLARRGEELRRRRELLNYGQFDCETGKGARVWLVSLTAVRFSDGIHVFANLA